jgi:hypothetical protein
MPTRYSFADPFDYGRFMEAVRDSEIGTDDVVLGPVPHIAYQKDRPTHVTFGDRPPDKQLLLDELAKVHNGEAEHVEDDEAKLNTMAKRAVATIADEDADDAARADEEMDRDGPTQGA